MKVVVLKKVLLICIMFFHLTIITVLGFYTYHTNFTGEFSAVSDHPHVITGTTPFNKQIIWIQHRGDTLKVHSRTFKKLSIITNDNKSYEIDFLKNKWLFEGFCIELKPEKGMTKLNAMVYLLNTTPLLKIFIIAWLVFGLLYLYLIYNRGGLKKYNFFRFLLKPAYVVSRLKSGRLVLSRPQKTILIFIFILLFAASYLKIGHYPFSQIAEEKRRALVSLEMKLQNNIIYPTCCGEAYYNKPPLFNWLLIPFIQNNNVEFFTRGISVSIMLISGVLIFLLLKKYQGSDHAAMVVLLFLSSYHVLFRLSLLLNLDILFSLFIICLFYSNYHFSKNNQYLHLFGFGYLLASLAFMTKGFPAIYFQFVSLFFALLINKGLKKIFSFQHLAGIAVFITIPATYLFLYQKYGDALLYIKKLIEETLIVNNFHFVEIVSHFFAFPGTNMLAFFPVLFLIPLLLLRRSWVLIFKNPRLFYLFAVIFAGCFVFAVSPYYQPYYCLMFVPLLTDLLLSVSFPIKSLNIKEKLAILLWGGVFFLFYILYNDFSHAYINALALLILLLIVFFFKHLNWLFLVVSGLMIVLKIVCPLTPFYNDLFLPDYRSKCEAIVAENNGKNILIASEKVKINHAGIFYLSFYSKQIIRISKFENLSKHSIYLGNRNDVPDNAIIMDSIPQYYWLYNHSEKLKGRNEYIPLMVYQYNGQKASLP